jgi:phenylacetate-CoA ligase
MFEKLIRNAFPELQSLYDKAPYPLQNLLTTARGYALAQMRYQRLFWEYLDELLDREKFTLAEIEAYQNEQLRNLIRYSYENVPFYRKYFSEQNLIMDDIKTIQDLPKLPVLTRETVRAYWKDLVSSSVPDRQKIKVFTSGTCGAGLPIVYDETALAKNWAFRARQKLWANINPREWRITFFGSKIVPIRRSNPPFWTYNYFEKQILMSIFHLSEGNKNHYINYLQSHANLLVEGFPSVLSIMSDFILEKEINIPMKAVFTDGEPLYPYIREKVESAFKAKVFDHYGMTEWVGLIQECEKGKYHLISDYGILEILDENYNPVSAGKEGYLVWTGFTNPTMPLIRYQIGDKGMWDIDQNCPCERPFPLVHPTITRDSDYLIAPDGRILSPRAINQLLKNKTSFKSCQFIQEDHNTIIIRVVAGNFGACRDSEEVKKGLYDILGESINVLIKEADKPIQYESGKIPLIVSKLGLPR